MKVSALTLVYEGLRFAVFFLGLVWDSIGNAIDDAMDVFDGEE